MMTEATSDQTRAVKQTPLHDNHVARGARMVDFAGWDMPLQFTKVMDEHHAVRSAAGLFDISHMGPVMVCSGNVEATRAFLDGLVPQNLAKLVPGKAVYTQFLNENGGIIDDLIVYMLPEQAAERMPEFQEFLIICNAANIEKDMAWLRRHAERFDEAAITLDLVQDRYALIALQGPQFDDILARTGYDTDHLPKRFHIQATTIQDVPVLVSRTGYTGEDGVELVVPNAYAEHLWEMLLELGKPLGIKPVGLAARDTLRLEAAYPLHGHDISENDTPLEAGLGWSVKLDKPRPFIGREALLRQREQGVDKEFHCFTLNKKTIARQHDPIYKEGVPVGEVTSGSISPLFNVPIGMGYIRAHTVTGPGDTIQIRVRGVDVDAEIVERPFYQL